MRGSVVPAGLAGKSTCSSQEETYELPDGNITTDGAVRLRCAGVLFQVARPSSKECCAHDDGIDGQREVPYESSLSFELKGEYDESGALICPQQFLAKSHQQMIMKRDIDIRKDVYAHVVMSGGHDHFQRIGTIYVAPSTMRFKVVASPKRKYSVLLLEPNARLARECCSSQVSPATIIFLR